MDNLKIDNLSIAAKMMMDDWYESLPDEFEHFETSKQFDRKMERLIDRMRGGTLHRFTRRTIRAMWIAAILLAIAAIAVAATFGSDFVVKHFDGFSTYNVVDDAEADVVESLTVSYVPEGFELTDKQELEPLMMYLYRDGDRWFDVSKELVAYTETVDENDYPEEVIKIGNIQYIYHKDVDFNGYVWNNGDYIYRIMGNLSKDDLLKIAQSVS